jgi:HAD superfamily hydrolase (TIGR01549 family)
VPYRAVLFDLFDTLVRFDRTRLPLVHVNGHAVHSTAAQLYEIARAYAPAVDFSAFVEAVFWSWQEAERLRAIDHREVPAPQRFRLLFRRLRLDPDAVSEAGLEALLAAHGRELARAAEFPEHHGPLLRRWAERYALAVVSNFDFTPTARAILDRAGVTSLFTDIIVSDQVGWRKPKAAIFEAALGRVGIAAPDALFVGDRADIDVVGAQGVGMDVAWINRGASPLPDGIRAPEFEIRDLADLGQVLEA